MSSGYGVVANINTQSKEIELYEESWFDPGSWQNTRNKLTPVSFDCESKKAVLRNGLVIEVGFLLDGKSTSHVCSDRHPITQGYWDTRVVTTRDELSLVGKKTWRESDNVCCMAAENTALFSLVISNFPKFEITKNF
ncbi:MAG: hypothetical protein UR66_C0003G0159 [Candidatus Moranbacteria bacterium GW2011_GWE1_35_17]|nr:MAG: hypothetical protein UR66_C0003G0159 [Candidatus Moranbacteria bacterium GW2011_GWE1_35_17]KKP72510.1 MAG: hypothetical protein UR65_C0014G0023 [Candidatus Moranbacteria bacterium GW2011_GWE2_35_164]KKP81757.1 MAG: hypothetical protein UR82_C0052G0005 [Candidatus Moranbacteria bacterium GW2011_GWF1_35_5]KKP84213.1 MAG: hypothetical protein UR83_C0025G0016 [Candidatus Moranbacteria bacterium GW2011_GWF2_35_54]